MEMLPVFFTLASISLLAAMTPGPDFALVTKNGLSYSRTIGVASALGISLGLLIHTTLALVGISTLFKTVPQFYMAFKTIGASYLVYLAYGCLKDIKQKWPLSKTSNLEYSKQHHKLTTFEAVKMGFWTNALNPKASLFVLSVFTQLFDIHTPLWAKIVAALIMFSVGMVWFSTLSYFITHQKVNTSLQRWKGRIEIFCGLFFLWVGIQIFIH